MYTVVDEMFLAGEIRETSQTKVTIGKYLQANKQCMSYGKLDFGKLNMIAAGSNVIVLRQNLLCRGQI